MSMKTLFRPLLDHHDRGISHDVLDSSGNYFFWDEHLSSVSRLERVRGCPHNLSSSWQRQQGCLVLGLNRDLPSLPSHCSGCLVNFFLISPPPFFLIVSVMTLTPESMLQLNVCSLGWVINSNTVRSVACVSLSLPESGNRWDRWKEPPTGTGSSRWRDLAVPVLTAGLAQRPLVGLSRPNGQAHIPWQWLNMGYVVSHILSAGSTRLTYTGWRGELELLKIKTRLTDERFASVMSECVIVTL